jgi:hypothetical protein
MFARVVKEAAGPHDPHAADRTFQSGLKYILDGIQQRIENRSNALTSSNRR